MQRTRGRSQRGASKQPDPERACESGPAPIFTLGDQAASPGMGTPSHIALSRDTICDIRH